MIKRARDAGALEIRIHNLRDWTRDRHKTIDDRPFGGGEGMLLKPEPLFLAAEAIVGQASGLSRTTVLLSAQGRLFDQKVANDFSNLSELLLICGRYEGVDERVAEHLADVELSIGNYVLSGGELAAAVVVWTRWRANCRACSAMNHRRCSSLFRRPDTAREGCSIARSTRVRRSFGDGRCRKFY